MVERTPDAILKFWLGPLSEGMGATSEDNWRERMLRWRVGVFARAREVEEFTLAQRELYEELHRLGQEEFFSPHDVWGAPRGVLAKLIVLDQLGRCVHRGTPLAYENDAQTASMLQQICELRWDITEYDPIQRMWVYVALSHPEDTPLQELSVSKWSQWAGDLVAASPPEYRRVNQRVSWYFVKSVIEHSEAVLLHAKFPHRNPILCRPHGAGEIHYLTSELRPLWSFTQPPRPLYYALHGALHALVDGADCEAIDAATLEAFESALLGPAANREGSLSDIFDVRGSAQVGFRDLYRHLCLTDRAPLLEAVRAAEALSPHMKRVTYAIFKDEDATWPPRSAKTNVPRVIDVPALNMAIGCPLLSTGDIRIPRAAVDAFVEKTGFTPCPLSELLERYERLMAGTRVSFEQMGERVRRTHPIDKGEFKALAGDLFSDPRTREESLGTLYELLDMDYDGTVDAGELVVALNALCSGTLQERLDVCFRVFDHDDSGQLEHEELWDLIHTTLLRGLHLVEALFAPYVPAGGPPGPELQLFSLADFAAIEQAASRGLSEADADGDGAVDRAEFAAWASEHPLLRQLFGLFDALFGSR